MSLSKLIDSLPDASQPGFYNVGYSGTQWHELEDEFGEPFEVDHFCLEEGLPPPNINSTVRMYSDLTSAIQNEVAGRWEDPSTYICVDGGLEDRTLRVDWNMRRAQIDESLLHFLRDYLAQNLPQWRIVIPMQPDEESILVYPMAIVPPRKVGEGLADFLIRKNTELLEIRDSDYVDQRNFVVATQLFDFSGGPQASKPIEVLAIFRDSRNPNSKDICISLVYGYKPNIRSYFAFDRKKGEEFSKFYIGTSNRQFLDSNGRVVDANDALNLASFEYIELACIEELFQNFIEIRDHEKNCNVRIPVDAPIWDESTADAMYEEILKNESKKD